MKNLRNVVALFLISLFTFTSCTKDQSGINEPLTKEATITDMESLKAYMEENPPELQELEASSREGYLPGVAPQAVKKMKVDLYGNGQLTEVDVEIKKGKVVIGGDIVLGTEKEVANRTKAVSRGLSVKYQNNLWENGIIPISVDDGIWNNSTMIQNLSNAVSELNNKTNLTIRLRNNEADYVRISTSTDGNYLSGGAGYRGGVQRIYLESSAPLGTYIHEILHAAGLYHEQGRCDRDNYIHVLWNNITSSKSSQFDKDCAERLDVYGYDFGSVMHYHPKAFSKNGGYTILPVTHKVWIFDDVIRFYDELGKMGQRSGLSSGDISVINGIYN